MSKVSKLNSVGVSELFAIESYENVHHLVSKIESELKDNISEIGAFWAAFPGGSITGAPKKRAMEIIEELEVHSRRYYCGSIFYWDFRGNFDSSILIRTAEKVGDKIYCWAGGGIVADSRLESEYQESLDKVRHITGIEV
jgi:para-aminobenzoate synthetase component 1